MNKTAIEWVKNPDGTQGYTWNPITGCLNHTNGLCNGGGFPCYAYKLAHTRLRDRYLGHGELYMKGLVDLDPFYPRFWANRLHEYDIVAGKGKGIFPCDMSDLFGIDIPKHWTSEVMNIIKLYQKHRFYLLTKQPQRLPDFSPFPDNCWVGVTVTRPPYFAQACGYLKDIQALIKYLSIEPYLCEIIGSEMNTMLMKVAGINWVIIGAQTKPYKPPRIEWVQEIVEVCDKAGIPVFLKDNLWKALVPVPKAGIPPIWARSKIDADCLRQEIPTSGFKVKSSRQ